jgi:ubiquinone/menaquinone biosynthesis C-methylase UbiE
MNIFTDKETADNYDAYYQTEAGKAVDKIEKNLFLTLMKNIPRGSLLEVGCGTGHWTEFFADQLFDVTAADSSENMLQIAERKNINAKFLKADAHRLPFDNKSFDAVSALTVMEFVDDRNTVFKEIYRMLKPGGWFILGALNARSEIAKKENRDSVFKHADFMSPETLGKELRMFGFPIINSGVHYSPEFKLLDGTAEEKNAEPAFMAAVVRKEK